MAQPEFRLDPLAQLEALARPAGPEQQAQQAQPAQLAQERLARRAPQVRLDLPGRPAQQVWPVPASRGWVHG